MNYMKVILLAGQIWEEILSCYKELCDALTKRRLQIAPEKLQHRDAYMYPAFQMFQDKILFQKNHPDVRQATEGCNTITLVDHVMQAKVTFMYYYFPLWFITCKTTQVTMAVFWKTAPILWVHLPISPKRVLNSYF